MKNEAKTGSRHTFTTEMFENERRFFCLSQRLQAALSLSPFRQQFDNFASLISLDTDSASGLTFEIFAQNLTENLLGASKENEKTGIHLVGQ